MQGNSIGGRLVAMTGLVVMVGIVTACSQPQASSPKQAVAAKPAVLPDEPGRVYLADRQFSMMPPSGFVPMPAEEVAKKYPAGNEPLQVFTNGDRTASIAVTFTQQPLALNQLPELQGLMSKHLEKTVPGLKWIRKDLLAINGGSWLNMEGVAQEQGEKLHSDMYFTSFQNRMIGVNFSADAKDFQNLRQLFNQSRDSIQVLAE
jgi:hypothetical protein